MQRASHEPKGSTPATRLIELGGRRSESIDGVGNRAQTDASIDLGGRCDHDQDVPTVGGCEIGQIVDWVIVVELDRVEINLGVAENDADEHGWTVAEGIEAPVGQGLKQRGVRGQGARRHRREPVGRKKAATSRCETGSVWQCPVTGYVLTMTELVYLQDAFLQELESTVVSVDDESRSIVLDRTIFYVTGGGQPHDTGSLGWASGSATVIDVRKRDGEVRHVLADGDVLPAVGDVVTGTIDWGRRHELMRTHTAMHILCGVIWNEYGTAVTGGNMEPLKGRMDFEFDPLPDGFAARVSELVNAEIDADRPIEVSVLPRDTALEDADLIRTKVNLIPEFVTEIRVIDIVGLDKQADGGTHVASTGEVGTFAITKTESKGKGNKRIRIELS